MVNARTKGTGRTGRGLLAACIALALLSPRPAAAQVACEPFFIPLIVELVLEEVQDYAIEKTLSPPSGVLAKYVMTPATLEAQSMLSSNNGVDVMGLPGISALPTDPIDVKGAVKDLLGNPEIGASFNYGGLGYMDIIMRRRLDQFWHDIRGAFANMTVQIYASGINTARLIASLNDAGNVMSGAAGHQGLEIDAKLQHVVTDESCQFDTTAQNLGVARAVSTAMTNAFADQVNALGNGDPGALAPAGPAGFQNMRFKLYRDKFCDVYSNGGAAPCSFSMQPPLEPEKTAAGFIRSAYAQSTPTPAKPNAAVTPGKTIFGSDTVDMSDPDTATAARELIFNITSFQPPPTLSGEVLKTSQGREQALINREYLTQMDSISSLAWGVIAERAPAKAAPQVQEMRQKSGIASASPNPSEREVLQGVVDQLSNPSYYVNLGEGGGSVAQKEVYMKAYNAMLLYKLIEKQEKVSAAYAIETGNMLKRYRDISNQRREMK